MFVINVEDCQVDVTYCCCCDNNVDSEDDVLLLMIDVEDEVIDDNNVNDRLIEPENFDISFLFMFFLELFFDFLKKNKNKKQ